MIGLDRIAIAGNRYRHGAVAAEDVGKRRLVANREIRDQHEGHTAVRRQVLEQDFQRFNAACGGADTDDGERLVKHGQPLCRRSSQDRSSIDRTGDDLKPGGASGYSQSYQ
jgi:hypothetical protein